MSDVQDDTLKAIDERIRAYERKLATLEPLAGRLDSQGADESGTDNLVEEMQLELKQLRERRTMLSALRTG